MANPVHLEILLKGVDTWNHWRKVKYDIIPDLAEADLSKMEFMRINLSKADLRMANLSSSDLRKADLNQVDLRNACLSEANLDEANLIGAYMSNTNLTYASFAAASLVMADLSSADLSFANLRNADLDDTNFSQSRMYNTILVNVDLSKSKNLEKVNSYGPSSIGIDTIHKSSGHIPEIFMQGCGVSETFLRYMKSLTVESTEYFSCFISYSHEDKPFARRLHDQLQARGIRCWLDEHQLFPGDDLHDMIDKGIRLWDKVLICCSKAALNSYWVDKELDRALKKEEKLWKERGKKVLTLIPLNLDGYLFDSWSGGKKDMVTSRLAADFTGCETDNAKFEEQFERVVKALQTEGAREEAPPSKL